MDYDPKTKSFFCNAPRLSSPDVDIKTQRLISSLRRRHLKIQAQCPTYDRNESSSQSADETSLSALLEKIESQRSHTRTCDKANTPKESECEECSIIRVDSEGARMTLLILCAKNEHLYLP